MVIEYMPQPFRFGNKYIRIIVDCIEFPVQKPSSPMEQQLTFSRYKNTNTLKGMIEPNDVVMADKGFFIAEELKSIGCKLQCPKFLKDKVQFDVSEMVINSQLSNMRITVERAISRVMQYKYFEGALPYKCPM
ncbi:THAP-type domain-containing protein [Nephila pilipes]|uniref:THAP-type domain-containing protein n=1 Tax=Nephila pilipes TaxID=299642 RepID=A0A8X6KJQ6_NEPPI|nr:THAP-type domain-containing protein [Nephila pilipes]